jgi:hypothetical protein
LCDACYFTHRSRQVAYGRWTTRYTDPGPTRQHIEALRARGLGYERIGDLCGLNKEVVRGIVVGRAGRPPVSKVLQRTEQRILAIDLPLIRDVYRMSKPGTRFPITGTRRRLQALMAIGYSQSWLCEQIRDSKWGNHTLWTDRHDQVTAAIAARVVELFDSLQLVPGPSDRARLWAARNGWPAPFDWDEEDIDDPAATPKLTGESPVTFLERYEELVDLGYHDHQIADRLGIQLQSLERSMYRVGLQPRRVAS